MLSDTKAVARLPKICRVVDEFPTHQLYKRHFSPRQKEKTKTLTQKPHSIDDLSQKKTATKLKKQNNEPKKRSLAVFSLCVFCRNKNVCLFSQLRATTIWAELVLWLVGLWP